jgi:hypothetical protein
LGTLILAEKPMTPLPASGKIVGMLAGYLMALRFAFPAEVTTVPPGYALAWADEFDAPAVNTNEWAYRTGKIRPFCFGKPEYVSLVDGAMRVLCARDGEFPTGGGLITRRRHRYGYFETRAKMDGGPGFHESMWTTWLGSMEAFSDPAQSGAWRERPRIEIDCFEHYAKHGPREFSYGIIEWFPAKGSVSRDLHQITGDLARDFHVYGFEFQPDYCNFFFDGKWIRTVDVRGLPQNDFHIWLTCIATEKDARPGNGGCLFDYLRCYTIDEAGYASRRETFLREIEARQGPVPKSRGTDIWIEAEDFETLGSWEAAWDDGVRAIRGLAPGKARAKPAPATKTIQIPAGGTYRLWVRGRDFAEDHPGARFFSVAVGGKRSAARFGTHRAEGFAWQDGGKFALEKGPVAIEIIDVSRFYARCDKLLLTSDPGFRP